MSEDDQSTEKQQFLIEALTKLSDLIFKNTVRQAAENWITEPIEILSVGTFSHLEDEEVEIALVNGKVTGRSILLRIRNLSEARASYAATDAGCLFQIPADFVKNILLHNIVDALAELHEEEGDASP